MPARGAGARRSTSGCAPDSAKSPSCCRVEPPDERRVRGIRERTHGRRVLMLVNRDGFASLYAAVSLFVGGVGLFLSLDGGIAIGAPGAWDGCGEERSIICGNPPVLVSRWMLAISLGLIFWSGVFALRKAPAAWACGVAGYGGLPPAIVMECWELARIGWGAGTVEILLRPATVMVIVAPAAVCWFLLHDEPREALTCRGAFSAIGACAPTSKPAGRAAPRARDRGWTRGTRPVRSRRGAL